MSISSEINRISGNVSSAFSAVTAKGGTVTSGATSDNLASAIQSIPQSGGSDSADIIYFDFKNEEELSFIGSQYMNNVDHERVLAAIGDYWDAEQAEEGEDVQVPETQFVLRLNQNIVTVPTTYVEATSNTSMTISGVYAKGGHAYQIRCSVAVETAGDESQVVIEVIEQQLDNGGASILDDSIFWYEWFSLPEQEKVDEFIEVLLAGKPFGLYRMVGNRRINTYVWGLHNPGDSPTYWDFYGVEELGVIKSSVWVEINNETGDAEVKMRAREYPSSGITYLDFDVDENGNYEADYDSSERFSDALNMGTPLAFRLNDGDAVNVELITNMQATSDDSWNVYGVSKLGIFTTSLSREYSGDRFKFVRGETVDSFGWFFDQQDLLVSEAGGVSYLSFDDKNFTTPTTTQRIIKTFHETLLSGGRVGFQHSGKDSDGKITTINISFTSAVEQKSESDNISVWKLTGNDGKYNYDATAAITVTDESYSVATTLTKTEIAAGSASGYTPVVLTCTVDFADAQLSENNENAAVWTPQLTNGTYAQALAAAEAGTPAVLKVTIQQTETDEETGESTTYPGGAADVFLQAFGGDEVGGFFTYGDDVFMIASIASDGTVDIRLTFPIGDSGDSETLRIPVTLTLDLSTLTFTQQLDSGTWGQAAQRLSNGGHAELLISMVAGDIALSTMLVPLRAANLDMAAYQAAVEAAAENGDEAPVPDSFYALTGECSNTLDAGLAMNAGLSIPINLAWKISLTADDTLTVTADTAASVNTLDVDIGQPLGDDVTIGSKTVAQIKTDDDVDDIYLLSSDTHTAEELGQIIGIWFGQILLAFGIPLTIRCRTHYLDSLHLSVPLLHYTIHLDCMNSAGCNNTADGIERQAWLKSYTENDTSTFYLYTREGGDINDIIIS